MLEPHGSGRAAAEDRPVYSAWRSLAHADLRFEESEARPSSMLGAALAGMSDRAAVGRHRSAASLLRACRFHPCHIGAGRNVLVGHLVDFPADSVCILVRSASLNLDVQSGVNDLRADGLRSEVVVTYDAGT